jgi:hypothetical protein
MMGVIDETKNSVFRRPSLASERSHSGLNDSSCERGMSVEVLSPARRRAVADTPKTYTTGCPRSVRESRSFAKMVIP